MNNVKNGKLSLGQSIYRHLVKAVDYEELEKRAQPGSLDRKMLNQLKNYHRICSKEQEKSKKFLSSKQKQAIFRNIGRKIGI